MVMGSLKAAIAFFSDDGSAKTERSKLVVAMYSVITNSSVSSVTPSQVFDYICRNDNRHTKEQFINASVAIKLALNFFDMSKDEKGKKAEKDGED